MFYYCCYFTRLKDCKINCGIWETRKVFFILYLAPCDNLCILSDYNAWWTLQGLLHQIFGEVYGNYLFYFAMALYHKLLFYIRQLKTYREAFSLNAQNNFLFVIPCINQKHLDEDFSSSFSCYYSKVEEFSYSLLWHCQCCYKSYYRLSKSILLDML